MPETNGFGCNALSFSCFRSMITREDNFSTLSKFDLKLNINNNNINISEYNAINISETQIHIS